MEKLAYYEVLLLMIPVALLFLAIYILFRQFFQNQFKLQVAQANKSSGDAVVRLKLHAYERLMLLCERIEIENLLSRLHTSQMTAMDLRSSLILAVQQEYEYNLSQQLYVSAQLWQIVEMAKTQVIEIITHVSANLPANTPARELSAALVEFKESQKQHPLETAKAAIRKESGMIL